MSLNINYFANISFFFILIYVYEYFAHMYIFELCVCLVHTGNRGS